MRTGLGKLGIAPHVAELAINHARKGIEATYDKYRYEGEIKTALTLWADHVLPLSKATSAKSFHCAEHKLSGRTERVNAPSRPNPNAKDRDHGEG